MKIIKEKTYHEETSYRLSFDYLDGRWGGFAFSCDKDGNIDKSKLYPEGLINYQKCISGEHKVVPGEIIESHHRWHEPAVGECWCGTHVELEGFTNTCEKCGTDYNWGGQQLAPRAQWGEETGESLSDILNIK